MKYMTHETPLTLEQRQALNEKVLYLIDSDTAETSGITREDIYNAYTGDGGLHGLKSGDFEKRYLAVLVDAPKEQSGTLKNYLKKNPINNMVYVATATTAGAKYAELDYRILQTENSLSLAEICLHTGRSHQIRVQMSSINCPLYGDMRYGGEKAVKGRLALWAYHLAFTHPVLKERLVFRVQPPKENYPWSLFDTESAVKIPKPEA